VVYELAWCIMY